MPTLNADDMAAVKMKGIQFVTDASGEKTAVLIDLRKHGELWEDIYDALTAHQRAREPRVSLETVKRSLIRQGKFGD